jgi:hypothetical protein
MIVCGDWLMIWFAVGWLLIVASSTPATLAAKGGNRDYSNRL